MQEQFSRTHTGFDIKPEDIKPPVQFDLTKPSIGSGFFEIQTDTVISENLENKARQPLHGNETATLITNADLLMKHGENELATHLLRKCLYLNSTHPEALKRLAECLTAEEDLPIKVKVMQTLVQSDLNFETVARLGHCYYQSKQDQKAHATYMQALSLLTDESPELFEVFKNLGNLNLRDGEFDSAEEYYNKAFTLNSRSDVLLVNLGTLALQQQALDLALTRFREALEINHRNDKAWVGLAMVHNSMGDHVLARANLENALDVNSSNRTAVHLATSWSVRDQDLGFAVSVLENYVSQVDCDEEMSLLLIHLFCLRNQFVEARLELERLLLWNPTDEKLLKIEQEIAHAKP